MKANELRIGNLVLIDNPKHHPRIKDKPLIVVAIDEIDEPKCSLICTDPKENLIIPAYSQFLKFIQPIPLTAEWLLELGFKPLCKDYQKKGVIIHTRKRGFVLRRKVPIIQHVHQLQNLFFALRGEELTIK